MAERVTNARDEGWIKTEAGLYERVKQATERLYKGLSQLEDGDENDVVVRRRGFYDKFEITAGMQLTAEDVDRAPKEVRMVFHDLGLGPEDQIGTLVTVSGTTSFVWGIRPAELTPDKVGIDLPTMGKPTIVGIVDGQQIESLHPADFATDIEMSTQGIVSTGGNVRAGQVTEHYGWRMAIEIGHPFMIDILTTGADWLGQALTARRNIPQIATPPAPLPLNP